MRKIIIGLICILSIFFMSLKLFESPHYEIPRSEKIVNKLLGTTASLFKEKYKLHPIGTCVAMPSGIIKELGLEFQVFGPLSKEEIRKILIICSQEFLDVVNNNVEIRPYLECYPFTIGRIEIGLFVINKDNSGVDYPHIRIADIIEQKLKYLKITNTDIPVIKDRCIESYEDALKAMENYK